MLSLEVARLINRGVKSGESEQLLGPGETMNIADLPENHPAIDISDSRDGHDNGVVVLHDVRHFSFNVVDLAIKEFDLFDTVDYLDR